MPSFSLGQAVAIEAKGLPSFGLNLDAVNDWAEPRFIDFLRSSRGWQLSNFGNIPPENLLPNGDPASLPSGETKLILYASSLNDQSAAHIGGTYKVSWEGECTITIGGGYTNRIDITANSFTFDITGYQGNLWFNVTPTNSANFPRNFTMIRTDHQAAYDAGEIFLPNMKTFLAQASCLRFMDWMGTNNSTVVEWADYKKQDYRFWNKRTPIEVIIRLCNETNTDAWVCIPHAASDAFVTSFAQYVLANLDSHLKIRVEVSNEIWNTGLFQAGAYYKLQAETVWGIVDGWEGFFAFAGKRFVETMKIFNTTFGSQQNRVIGVLAGQSANSGVASTILDSVKWQTYEPANYEAPYLYAKELAITGYIGNSIANENAQSIVDALAISQANAKAFILSKLPDAVVATKGYFDIHRTLAANKGLQLSTYEANQHLDLWSARTSVLFEVDQSTPKAGMVDLFEAVCYSTEMGGFQDEIRDYIKQIGGTMYCGFGDIGPHTKYGSWGKKRHLSDNSPPWNAMEAWSAANPRWWL